MPEAVALDRRVDSPEAEFNARARMTLRSFLGTLDKLKCLHPIRSPGVVWAVLSHKILRWLTPYLLLLVFVMNLYLAQSPPYAWSLLSQVLFYSAGALGWALERACIRLPLLSTVSAICLMNLGMLAGVSRAVLGKRIYVYRSE
jgi:hypothetical protein